MVVVPHFTVFVVELTTTTTFVCILELPQFVVSRQSVSQTWEHFCPGYEQSSDFPA